MNVIIAEKEKMNKENNRSAAGLRRSAVAERLRLREEWLELKGTDVPTTSRQNVLNKKQMNTRCTPSVSGKKWGHKTIHKAASKPCLVGDALCGVVALVCVGAEARALALRAALAALGASVAPAWSPLVTHLVWADGGCRSSRAKARALGCWLVSPLWVEACAAAASRLAERAFPTATRQSDLPSPRTLRQLLKRAEMENVPLVDLLSDSKEDEADGQSKPLRISTDTEHETSADNTTDTSNDTIDIESRINTAPRRALPNKSMSLEHPRKSRRKLFTHKEAQLANKSSDEESDTTTNVPTQKRVRIQHNKLTQRDKKDLVRAERMAKRILASCTTQDTRNIVTQNSTQYRIVLTGMSRTERQSVTKAIQELNGRIQNHVTKRTTHVLLGSCRNETTDSTTITNNRDISMNTCSKRKNISSNNKKILSDINKNNCLSNRELPNITGVTYCDLTINTDEIENNGNLERNNGDTSDRNGLSNGYLSINIANRQDKRARTLNALQGAARGCRVLHARWAIDSADAKKWLHHNGYEVHHLRKICQKARVERSALGRTHSDYAYDVFNGMRIRITPNADQRDAAIQLLGLCGAVVLEQQDGGRLQDGGRAQNGGLTQTGVNNDCDVIIGVDVGQVGSKWVFDSVAAARMRTTRRYIN